MIVTSITANSGPRKRNRSRANAYAVSEQLSTFPTIAAPATMKELRKSVPNETAPRAFQPSG